MYFIQKVCSLSTSLHSSLPALPSICLCHQVYESDARQFDNSSVVSLQHMRCRRILDLACEKKADQGIHIDGANGGCELRCMLACDRAT